MGVELGEWKGFVFYEAGERGAKEMTVALPEGHPMAPKKVRRSRARGPPSLPPSASLSALRTLPRPALSLSLSLYARACARVSSAPQYR
eukprot:COSAG02_NODE_41364_length_395_cov_0.885135_1_plen_88_part_10